MEVLKKLKAWLMTFPQWEDVVLQVDDTAAEPVNCGLFPVGVEELSRKEDLLGRQTIQCKQTFLLRRVTPREEDAAAWMMALQDWVRRQSKAGTAPQLGDAPKAQWIRAEKGRLLSVSQTGVATYEIRLICEYTQILEE